MQLGYLRLDWPSLSIALGVGVAAAIALVLLRRILGWALGPIFVYETTRLARKGHTFWLRCVFALGILALLFFVAPRESDMTFGFRLRDYDDWELSERGESIEDSARAHASRVMSRFAQEFSNAFVIMVAISVMLVTPLYMATAISEEKEKRSIDFLLATHLTNYELVVGKFAARFLNLVGVLLTSLPILALTQCWGGVDVGQLVRGCIAILFAMFSYASVAVLCSSLTRRTRNAVILAYGLLAAMNLIVSATTFWELPSPVAQIIYQREFPALAVDLNLDQTDSDDISAEREFLAAMESMAIYCVFHSGISFVCIGISILAVRRLALKAMSRVRRVYSAAEARGRPKNRPVHPLTVKNNPPVSANPLVWKERYVGRTFGGFAVGSSLWLLVNLMIVSFFPILLIVGAREWQDLTHGIPMRLGLIFMGVIVMIGVGMRMASCVTREREQDTMLSLMTLPVRKAEILRAKWIGALFRSARPILSVALLFVLTAISAAMPIENGLLLFLTMSVHTLFAGNLGLLLSVYCRSSTRAFSFLLISLLLLVAGSSMATYLAKFESSYHVRAYSRHSSQFYFEEPTDRVSAESLKDALNPIRVWWQLTEYEGKPEFDDQRNDNAPYVNALISNLVFGVGSAFLYYLALLRFRREGSRA